MRCNGKCQMMKKIQKEEKKEQENPERKSENKNETVLSTRSFFATINRHNPPSRVKKIFPQVDNKYVYNPAYSIFHPPQA